MLPSKVKNSVLNKVGGVSSYPEYLNPFQSALSQISLDAYENMRLNEFLNKIIITKNINELNEIVDKALESGIRINARNEMGYSFSDITVLKMHTDNSCKFKEDNQENIIKKLMLKGADFDENVIEKTTEIYNKLQREVESQIHNQLTKLREIGESAAVEGTVRNVEIDNKTFYIEFSQNSVVDVAKIVEGTRDLGLSKGDLKLGGNIVKIGNGEVEVKTEKNGKRNYIDISDHSSFTVTFDTSLGKLNIKVYHDGENHHNVQVRVEDQEKWNELQKIGEIVGENCLFGGVSVNEVIEKGGFVRSGRRSNKITEEIKNSTDRGETWVNKITNNKTTDLVR